RGSQVVTQPVSPGSGTDTTQPDSARRRPARGKRGKPTPETAPATDGWPEGGRDDSKGSSVHKKAWGARWSTARALCVTGFRTDYRVCDRSNSQASCGF